MTKSVASSPGSSGRSFIITQTLNAGRGIIKQFKIEGINGFGPKEFMQLVKPEVLKLMRGLFLNIEMMRNFEFENAEVNRDVFFNSSTFENLHYTDEFLQNMKFQ